jgi:hypothetical protein
MICGDRPKPPFDTDVNQNTGATEWLAQTCLYEKLTGSETKAKYSNYHDDKEYHSYPR